VQSKPTLACTVDYIAILESFCTLQHAPAEQVSFALCQHRSL